MGHEVRLQTVPLDHPLIEEWFDPAFAGDSGDRIQQLIYRFGELRRGMNPEPFFSHDPPDYQRVQRDIVGLAKQYPWLPGGFVDLDRVYDYVIVMLERWSEDERATELARAAVLGAEQVAGKATATQGFPINFLTAQQAAEIFTFLKRIEKRKTYPELAFDQIPEERYLYKRRSESYLNAPARTREFELEVSRRFRPLLAFYQAARQSGFGVVSVRD